MFFVIFILDRQGKYNWFEFLCLQCVKVAKVAVAEDVKGFGASVTGSGDSSKTFPVLCGSAGSLDDMTPDEFTVKKKQVEGVDASASLLKTAKKLNFMDVKIEKE